MKKNFDIHFEFSIGFTVSCRFTWGMRGGYFPIIIRYETSWHNVPILSQIFQSIRCHLVLRHSSILGWASCSSCKHDINWVSPFWPCTPQAIGAIIPGFAHMKNTIPLSSHITTNDLIGVIIWYIFYIPLVRQSIIYPFGIPSSGPVYRY